jgi:hypothetical protein
MCRFFNTAAHPKNPVPLIIREDGTNEFLFEKLTFLKEDFHTAFTKKMWRRYEKQLLAQNTFPPGLYEVNAEFKGLRSGFEVTIQPYLNLAFALTI